MAHQHDRAQSRRLAAALLRHRRRRARRARRVACACTHNSVAETACLPPPTLALEISTPSRKKETLWHRVLASA
eukprot:6210900-Pleurochrysis_carterae.AAC.1